MRSLTIRSPDINVIVIGPISNDDNCTTDLYQEIIADFSDLVTRPVTRLSRWDIHLERIKFGDGFFGPGQAKVDAAVVVKALVVNGIY